MKIEELKRLAGITNEFKGQKPFEMSQLENMSKTAAEVVKKQKDNNIKPGDPEWFKLWFSRPLMNQSGFKGFRGRKKNG